MVIGALVFRRTLKRKIAKSRARRQNRRSSRNAYHRGSFHR